MNESKFYQYLKKNVFCHLKQFHPNRIETSMCNGFPDIVYTYIDHHGFIELKYFDGDPRPEDKFKLKHPITSAQVQWLTLNNFYGSGHCFLVIGTKSKIYWIKASEIKYHMTRPNTYIWKEIEEAAHFVLDRKNLDIRPILGVL